MKNALIAIFAMATLVISGCDNSDSGPGNHAPVIVSLSVDQGTLLLGDTVTLTCEATDEDGDVLSYTWMDNGEVAPETGSTVEYFADEIGSFPIVCTVKDDEGAEASETINLVVSAQPFMKSYTLSVLALLCSNESIVVATDPNATGALTINTDYSFNWSTTLIDDSDGTIADCVGGDFSVFTFVVNGTVTHNGSILTFDIGDGEPWDYEWEIDEGNTLILSDEDSFFEFD